MSDFAIILQNKAGSAIYKFCNDGLLSTVQ